MDISLNQAPPITEANDRALLQVSVEVVLYLSLFLAALVLRLANLDAVPLNSYEAHEALSALHRVNPSMTTSPAIAENPLMTFFNQGLFFFVADNEFTARLPTALIGALMVWGPWLWRKDMGNTAAFIMALLLAISPVALAASRLMGGVIWTMAIAFVVVWAVMRYAERGDPALAILATVGIGSMLVLTEPTGALTVIALGVGLLMAIWGGNMADNEPLPASVNDILRAWPWRDALLATIGFIMVVGTGFLATPEGLSSVGNTIYNLAQGFTSRHDALPSAYALVVALRYDLGLVLLGLVGMYFALAEGNRLARFLSGWLVASVIFAVFYQDAPADAALWISVPAAGLTALLAARMITNPSIGYWVVPNWGVPVHAFLTASLLVAIALNAIRISHVVYLESRPFSYHFISSPLSAAEISTIDPTRPESTFELQTNANTQFVLQLWRYDGDIDPIARIVTESQDPATGAVVEEIIAGPFSYEELRDGQLINLRFPDRYFIKVVQGEIPADQTFPTGQYVLLTHPATALNSGAIFNTRLDAPLFWTLIRSLRNQQFQPLTLIITVFLVLLTTIGYFLAGSIWGSRAAWRGLGFGFLIYFSIYGLGLGWQASVIFADDPRELWHIAEPAPQRTDRLVETLEDMGRHGTGIGNTLSITVLGDNDTTLAWTLRNFEYVEFVSSVGIETNTQAVIVPRDEQGIILGADYVGQDFVLGQAWQLSSLAWTDFISWLSLRETRFEPTNAEWMMLWVRSDVYGVDEVIPTEAVR